MFYVYHLSARRDPIDPYDSFPPIFQPENYQWTYFFFFNISFLERVLKFS